MGEWHGFEDYSPDIQSHSLLVNKLRDILAPTHHCWMHDPIKHDGLGIFGFVKKQLECIIMYENKDHTNGGWPSREKVYGMLKY